MAKKQAGISSDLFTKTEPVRVEKPEDKIHPRGIGLRQSDWVRFDRIAHELRMTPHSLSLFIIREWMKKYEAGEIKTETGKRLIGDNSANG